MGSATPARIAAAIAGGVAFGSFGFAGAATASLAPVTANAVAIEHSGGVVAVGSDGAGFALARYTRAGRLDRGFGSKGRVMTDFCQRRGLFRPIGPLAALSYGIGDHAQAAAIDSSDRIVVAGRTGCNAKATHHDFALARYLPDGKLDRAFGRNGLVTTDFGGSGAGSSGHDSANAVAIDASGRIVAAGYSGRAFALARYKPDGTLDPTFGTGGKVVTGGFATLEGVRGIAMEPSGAIVVAGDADSAGEESSPELALARYTPNGALDPTFGSGGKVTTRFPPNAVLASANAVVIDAAGEIIAAGGSVDAGSFILARYTPNGSLDSTFGGGGDVLTHFSSSPAAQDVANAVAIDPSGRIIAAGAIWDGGFGLARYTPSGSLDSGFGSAGKVATIFEPNAGDAGANGLVIDGTGDLVAAGDTCCDPRSGYDFAIARYTANGALDPAFGSGGTLVTRFPPDTVILSGRKLHRGRHRVTFAFIHLGRATGYECALNASRRANARFGPCGQHSAHGRLPSGKRTYRALHRGHYTFRVRAVGPAGHDLSPAYRRFRIR